MTTFVIGILILVVGGLFYGRLCEKIISPDDRKTPAVAINDGLDYVPMKRWRNTLVDLLNIAGPGPILGPIQGILFGPIAFITIPVGCVIAGAMHDYFSGMISEREGGKQMPELIRHFSNRNISIAYTLFTGLLMLLVGTVFIYTPGDIAATQLLGMNGSVTEPSTWIIYGVIFVYYVIATLQPINKIIGRIYPIFGAILLLSASGILVMLLTGHYTLVEIWDPWTLNGFDFGAYFREGHFIPMFFIVVACGLLSGFHATQTTLISRTISREKDGRMTFYNMMIAEGFIAMVWAAATMAMIGLGAENGGISMKFIDGTWQYMNEAGQVVSPTSVVGIISRQMLGDIGGTIAIIGVIILPITTGDTALRSLRLMIAEFFHIDQNTRRKRLLVALPIFAVVIIVLIFAKFSPSGFNTLWRYMNWANQTLSIFTFGVIIRWMLRNGKIRFIWMPVIPMAAYTFITTSYILNAPIGFRIPWLFAYIGAGVITAFIVAFSLKGAKRYL